MTAEQAAKDWLREVRSTGAHLRAAATKYGLRMPPLVVQGYCYVNLNWSVVEEELPKAANYDHWGLL